VHRRLAASGIAEVRSILGTYPVLALPIERRRGRGPVVDRDTDIVIEGFPSSANSFAVAAFQASQEPSAVRIAHHTHAAAQVIRAVRWSIPALVLIRRPEDAVLSQLARSRSLRPATVLRSYIRFHRALLPHRGGFVVGTFDEVVADYGPVIERVNQRFGRSFVPFEHSDAEVQRIEEAIERHERSTRSAGDVERMIPLPSAVRDELKRRRAQELEHSSRRLRARARELYDTLAR